MRQQRGVRSFLRKVVITTLSGAVSYPLTNMLFDSAAAQFVMSAAVGAIALIVQLLVEIEHRLASVESTHADRAETITSAVRTGLMNVNEATRLFGRVESAGLNMSQLTQLAQKAAGLGTDAPPLFSALAKYEIERATGFLDALAGHESTHDGEDHEFLLMLTQLATKKIDAVSLFTVDAGGEFFEHGFWDSDLGQRYLNLQRQAILLRSVNVRRVFVIGDEPPDSPAFMRMCQQQTDCGIEVRLLPWSSVPPTMRHLVKDYIVFDDAVSYEVIPQIPTDDRPNPLIAHTKLVFESSRVAKDCQIYAELWDRASGMPTLPNAQKVLPMTMRSSPGPR